MKKIYFIIIVIVIGILICSSFLEKDNKKNVDSEIGTLDIKIGEKVYTSGKYIYVYGKGGIRIYEGLKLSLEDSFNLEDPYMASHSDKMALGDKNGRVVRVYSKDGHMYTVNTPNNILGFSINKSGFLAIILKNESFYQIELFNPKGDNIFSIKEIGYEEGVPVSVAVSNDGKMLALAYLKTTKATVQSKIAFHSVEEGKVFGGVNKDGQFVSIIKFSNNNNLVGISDKEIFNLSINIEKTPAKIVQTRQQEIKNIIKYVKFLDDAGYILYYGASVQYDEDIKQNFIKFYNVEGDEISTYHIGDKDIKDIWANKYGAIILEGRLFTAISTSGKEMWSYQATQDIKNMIFYNDEKNVIIVTNNQIKIMKMDKGFNKMQKKIPSKIEDKQKNNKNEKTTEKGE